MDITLHYNTWFSKMANLQLDLEHKSSLPYQELATLGTLVLDLDTKYLQSTLWKVIHQ